MSLNLENILGFKVRVIDVLDNLSEGIIYSFNSGNNTITLQTAKKNNNNKDFKIIKCSFIKSLEVVGDKPSGNNFKKQPVKPSHVNIDRIKQQLDNSLVNAAKKSTQFGKNVSPEGQFIFDMLFKTISDTKWVKKNIVVLDDVEVVPPYKISDIKLIGDARQQSLDLVKKIVAFSWDRLDMNGAHNNCREDDEDERKGG